MRIVVSVILFPVLLVFPNMCMLAWGMAFIPAFISAVCAVLIVVLKQRRTGHVAIFVLSAVVWFLYAFCERGIPSSVNNRVDLVLFFPVLYAVSLAVFFGLMSLAGGAPTNEVIESASSESATSINHFIGTKAVNYFFWGFVRPR